MTLSPEEQSTRVSVKLGSLAHARSGDKGSSVNIGVIANTEEAYLFLKTELTCERVDAHFTALGGEPSVRYELPKLHAFNFVIPKALAGGGSQSLRIDAQGKTLGQAILQMSFEVPERIVLNASRQNEES